MSEQASDHGLEARRWLRYAQEDLAAAEVLAKSSEAVPREACLLAQQAAEKALKSVLVLSQIEFPRTHNLDVLRNMLPDGAAAKTNPADLAELAAWAVEARYPGDWPEATADDARLALDLARRAVNAVKDDLAQTTAEAEES